MRKFVLILALLIACSAQALPQKTKPKTAGTKINKPVLCFPLKSLLDDITNNYQEEAMIMGVNGYLNGIGMAVYVNRETGSYTIIEFDSEIACVLSTGGELHYRFPTTGLPYN